MKKKIILIAVLVALVITGICAYFIFFKNSDTENNLASIENNINKQYSDVIVTDIKTAKESLEDVKEELKINSVDEEFEEELIDQTGNSINTYKLKQTYNGLDVYYSGLTIYTDKAGNTKGIINDYKESINVNINPKSSDEELKKVLAKELDCEKADIAESKLVIYPLEENYVLAHEYKINTKIAKENITTTVIVNDETKEIIDTISPIKTITNKELSEFYINGKYELHDVGRNISIWKPSSTTLKPGEVDCQLYSWKAEEDATKEENQHAIKAIQTIQKCYDYYEKKFNYLSIDGKGEVPIHIITSAKKVVTPVATANNFDKNAAFTSPNLFILGHANLYNDNIEVLGHEYTHGVFNYTVGAISGNNMQGDALNEAYADVMGMCIEAYYNNSQAIDGYISSSKGRNIKDSKLVYQDFKTDSFSLYVDEKLGRDEHYYSKIISKAGYTMNEFLTLEELENLWFDSMKILGENPSFYDCVYAVIATSREMNLSQEKQANIVNAFSRVGFTIDAQGETQIEEEQNEIIEIKEADKKIKNSELENVYAFAIKLDKNSNASIVALKEDGTEVNIDTSNIKYDCIDYSNGKLYLQNGTEFYSIDLSSGNGNYKVESIYKVTSDQEWYNKQMAVYDGVLYFNKANSQIIAYNLSSKEEKIIETASSLSGNSIEFRIDKSKGILYHCDVIARDGVGVFGIYNMQSGEKKEILRQEIKNGEGIRFKLGAVTDNGVLIIHTNFSEVTGYEYNVKTNEQKSIDVDMLGASFYDEGRLYYTKSVSRELLVEHLLKFYENGKVVGPIVNTKEESIDKIFSLKNGNMQIVVSGGQDISTSYTKTYLIDKETAKQIETDITYDYICYIVEGADRQTNINNITPSNNTAQAEQLIGKWKVTSTNSAEYSPGMLFGSSISMANSLEFKQDGTYSLGVGFAYAEEGNYEIQGDTIKLTNIKDKTDNPDVAQRGTEAELKIKQVDGKLQVILGHKQDEYKDGKVSETLTIEVIFEKL